MKSLYIYLEDTTGAPVGASTPANTTGMGNPGEIAPGTLSEPIQTASCIRQNEKKKKRKIKESIFDDELEKNDILIGDILELDRWDCSNSMYVWNLPKMLDAAISSSSALKTIKKPDWVKFLRPFAKSYERGINSVNRISNYLECWQLVFFTWIIMCSKGKNEIKRKLDEFINETIDKKYSIEVIPIEGVGTMRNLVRMVGFKFKFNDSEILFYITLKKRD